MSSVWLRAEFRSRWAASSVLLTALASRGAGCDAAAGAVYTSPRQRPVDMLRRRQLKWYACTVPISTNAVFGDRVVSGVV